MWGANLSESLERPTGKTPCPGPFIIDVSRLHLAHRHLSASAARALYHVLKFVQGKKRSLAKFWLLLSMHMCSGAVLGHGWSLVMTSSIIYEQKLQTNLCTPLTLSGQIWLKHVDLLKSYLLSGYKKLYTYYYRILLDMFIRMFVNMI